MSYLQIQALSRDIIGLIFILAGVGKLSGWKTWKHAVGDYQILPPPLERLVTWTLPMTEVLTAIALLCGIRPQIFALLAAVLLGSFTIAVVTNLLRGRDIDCHCFGRMGDNGLSWKLVLRNVALLLLALSTSLQNHATVGLRGNARAELSSAEELVLLCCASAVLLLYLMVDYWSWLGTLAEATAGTASD